MPVSQPIRCKTDQSITTWSPAFSCAFGSEVMFTFKISLAFQGIFLSPDSLLVFVLSESTLILAQVLAVSALVFVI